MYIHNAYTDMSLKFLFEGNEMEVNHHVIRLIFVGQEYAIPAVTNDFISVTKSSQGPPCLVGSISLKSCKKIPKEKQNYISNIHCTLASQTGGQLDVMIAGIKTVIAELLAPLLDLMCPAMLYICLI